MAMQVFSLLFCFGLYCALARATNYKVEVKTSNDIGAGTDAKVWIKIVGEIGTLGETRLPTSSGHMETGDTDEYGISGTNVGRFKYIEIKRNKDGTFADWRLDRISIRYYSSSMWYTFSYNGWVSANRWIIIPLTGCPSGYNIVQGYCTDRNECQELGGSACKDSSATCHNTAGSYTCQCPVGYKLQNGQPTDYCIDIDECQLGTCHSSSTKCKNNQGSYVCECKPGFERLSQFECKNIDECARGSPCNDRSNCRDTIGSYACDCKSGFNKPPGETEQSAVCNDVDECQTKNDCQAVIATCENTAGSYRCKCAAGYVNRTHFHCVDKDECANSDWNTCDAKISICQNFEGGYLCDCKSGYHQGSNNKICEGNICAPLVPPQGSVLEPSRCTLNNANRYGDICTLKCSAGYVIEDPNNNSYKCGPLGRWEGTKAVCKAVSCPALSTIANGGIWPDTCGTIGGKYGGKCSYFCNSGYSLTGGQEQTCQVDGTWSAAAPTCSKVVHVPWIACPENIVIDLKQDESTADVSALWKEPQSNVQPITIQPSNLGPNFKYPAGQTKITWSVTNSAGSASCVIYVTVNDKQPPVVHNCPAGKIYKETTERETAVTWTEPTFTDNVGVTKKEASHSSGHKFMTGTYNIYYKAYDAARNLVNCDFQVVVKRKGCAKLIGPVGGTQACSNFGSLFFCTITCTSGTEIFKSTAAFPNYWSCDQTGVWSPTPVVPECVEATVNADNSPCPDGQVLMDVTVFGTVKKYCAKCPTGMFFTASDCQLCAGGKYQDVQGQLMCKDCPQGKSSFAGAKSEAECKAPCPPGKFSENGLGPNCQSCFLDTYQNNAQQTKCEACPNGTHTEQIGARSIDDCGVDPKITGITPTSLTIKEKTDAAFECRASGLPRPKITWTFLQTDIPAEFLGKMTQEPIRDSDGNVVGAKLVIEGAKVKNTGSYECTAVNSHGKAMDTAQLTVQIDLDFGSGADEGFI